MNVSEQSPETIQLENLRKYFNNQDVYFMNWVSLATLYLLIFRVRMKLMTRSGLTLQQASILYYISLLDYRVTPSILAKYVQKERHSLSEILARMEEKGLVYRYPSPNNKRERPVQITEKARNLLEIAVDRAPLNDVFKVLSKSEQKQYFKIVNKLMEATVKLADENGLPTEELLLRHKMIMDNATKATQ